MLSAKHVSPGKSGEIEVTVRTEGQTALSKRINVRSNDPEHPLVTLTVTAEVRPEFSLSEKSIYFGSAPQGRELTREIVITLPSDGAVRLLSAETTDPNVTVRLEPVPDSNGKRIKLVAVQKADAKGGYHFGIIRIKTTSSLTPELRIPVRGQITAGQSN